MQKIALEANQLFCVVRGALFTIGRALCDNDEPTSSYSTTISNKIVPMISQSFIFKILGYFQIFFPARQLSMKWIKCYCKRMKTAALALFFLCLAGTSHAQDSKSLIDRAPDIIHLADFLEKPFKLQVKENSDVFSDKNAKNRIGLILGNQTVELEAMTEWAYKVRGKGEKYGIVGWVNPKAFDSKDDPAFIDHLKQAYKRQIEVQALINDKKIALGMTQNEVSQSIGKPTKTQTRQTSNGITARWEYVTYTEIKHYDYIRNPTTGQIFQQLSFVSKEEKTRKTWILKTA